MSPANELCRNISVRGVASTWIEEIQHVNISDIQPKLNMSSIRELLASSGRQTAYSDRPPYRFTVLQWRHGIFFFLLVFLLTICFPLAVFDNSRLPSEKRKSTPCTVQNTIANDILVVLRTNETGVIPKTGAARRLSVHFDTTFRCIPNYIVFYDYQASAGTKEQTDTQDIFKSASSPLDFLFLVERSLKNRPFAKWFVFIEEHTSLVWSNLLEYLSKFDAGLPYYIGEQAVFENVSYAHSSAGFVLSNSAAEMITQRWHVHGERYSRYRPEQWAGDMVLGKAMEDAGIQILQASLHFQGDSLSRLDYNSVKVDRQPWCYPAITYHNEHDEQIKALWGLEQEWNRRYEKTPIRHRDIFLALILPHLRILHHNWDNLSLKGDIKTAPSAEKCRSFCRSNSSCYQFSYSAGQCTLSPEIRLGYPANSKCLFYSSAAGKCLQC